MHIRLKTWVAQALDAGGVFSLAEHLLRSRRKIIFTLHRVIPWEEMSECYNPYLALSPESFDHLLGWLRRRSAVVSFDELLEQQDSRSAMCAITFDDGWEDNYRVAFPILQAHGVPALIYVVTGLVGGTELFPEEQLWRILRTASPTEKVHIAERLAASVADGGLLSALKGLPHDRKIKLLHELRPGGHTHPGAFMTWDQVQVMLKAGHSFGSHTVRHTILPLEDDTTVAHELTHSKQVLEDKLGRPTAHFAFPSGQHDERTMEAVRAAGYTTAVTTSIGTLRSGYNPFRIPRLPMDNTVVNDRKERFAGSRARLAMVRGMAGPRSVAPDYLVPADHVTEEKRALKVLLIIDEMEAVTAGGTERQVLQIARLLAEAGVEVHFAVLRRTQWLDSSTMPCPVMRFELDRVKSWRGMVELIRLLRWMRRERFDVVQSFFVEANFVVPILARLARVPVALGSRRNLNYWMSPFWGRLQRISNHFATRLVANCEAVKRVVQETENVSPDKIDVVYNGLDAERFRPDPDRRRQTREQHGFRDSDVVIGTISVLRPIKGCETFIDAAIEVARHEPNARFVLVGDGPLRAALEERAAPLGDRVRFVGAQHDIRPFLNMFDVAVLASESEGFSNSILEYMAAGLPSVVSNAGGNPEAVGDAGIVVETLNPGQLAQALRGLVNAPEKRQELSEKALRRARNFNLETTQETLLAYYRRLLQEA